MAEGDGLLSGHISLSDVGRTIYYGKSPSDPKQNEDRAENTDFRKRIGARVEDLGHDSCLASV